MTDKIIMLCTVLAAVAVIAALFIRRAVRYRKRVNEAVGASAGEDGITMAVQGASPIPQGKYEILFINLVRLPFGYGKQVHIRPEYHRMIRSIIHTIGQDEVSITTYVDNVLKAHFDEYRDEIARLHRESGGGDFNTKA